MYQFINATTLSFAVGNGRWLEVPISSELGQQVIRDGVELVVRDPFAGLAADDMDGFLAACEEVLSLDF